MQWDRHKRAKQEVKEIFNKLENYQIIHYSCQSFNRVENGKTAVVTSIAIFSCASQSTTSFDIQSIAERLNIAYKDISNSENLYKIEEVLLSSFFDFLEKNQNYIYLHWNMRDSQYGFQALSNRYAALTGKEPYILPLEKQRNIAMLLDDYYGLNYVPDPKMKCLVEKNPSIEPRDIMYGAEEADAFDECRYNALHRSTLSKVRLFFNILKLVDDNKLITDNSFVKSFVSVKDLPPRN